MRRRTVIISITLLALITLGAARIGILPYGTPLDFLTPRATWVRSWNHTLRDCADAKAAEKAIKINRDGGTVCVMDDGTWVVIVTEHTCCSGAGFDAALYVTSNKESYLDTKTNYCEFSLADEVAAHSKKNIPEFLASVHALGRRLSKY